MIPPPLASSLFFFNDTATTEIYTLSLHDALPISHLGCGCQKMTVSQALQQADQILASQVNKDNASGYRSEEHTSELQSRLHLVCRLLLEKKKKTKTRS